MTLTEQIQNKCIHFTGLGNTSCKLGIAYEDVKVPGVKPYQFPCLKNTFQSGGSCDKCQFPSAEEADKQADEMGKSGGKAILGLIAVKKHAAATGIKMGKITCPSCGGDLNYSVASNGHTRGNCACGISWIE